MKNKDMLAVFNTIQDVIERTFPPDYLAFVYSDEKIDSQLIALQVMMECCKFAHDETSEKHSLRYFLQKEGKDSDDDYRMMIQRTLRNISNCSEPLLTAGRSQRSQQKQLSKLHKR